MVLDRIAQWPLKACKFVCIAAKVNQREYTIPAVLRGPIRQIADDAVYTAIRDALHPFQAILVVDFIKLDHIVCIRQILFNAARAAYCVSISSW